MVTPSYGADCANVEYSAHEGYARVCVRAYWRHMDTSEWHASIEQVTRCDIQPPPQVYWGATSFVTPSARAGFPEEDRYLGIPDLYMAFDGRKDGWALGLMEMLVDPMLLTWVPAWVREQYERANPYFRSVLKHMQNRQVSRNKVLLMQIKK